MQMHRWWFNRADAYINASDGKSVMWGAGFEGYDSGLSLKNNIIKKFGDLNYFSALDVFIDIGKGKNYNRKKGIEVKDLSHEIVVIVSMLECYSQLCKDYIDMFAPKILTMAYAKEAAEYAYDKNVNVEMIVHLPTTAPASFYHSVNHKNRSHGAVLVGSVGAVGFEHIYRLRLRWKALIETGKIPQSSIYFHPGYYVKKVEEQREAYFAAMYEHKIALFCSTCLKYQLERFSEAAIAGILIIADLPDDDPEFWAEHIVQVDVNMTDDKLIEIVKYWLDHDAERIAKAEGAQKAVMSKYTTMHAVELLAKSVSLHSSGFRGTLHNYPFINSCTEIGFYDQRLNKWCSTTKPMKSKNTEIMMASFGVVALLMGAVFIKRRKNTAKKKQNSHMLY